jgi:hypothetical protein
LKRKLRSVNALSCASINTTLQTPATSTAAASKPVETAQPQPQKSTLSLESQPDAILQPAKKPIEPVVVVGVVAPPELIPESVEEISHSRERDKKEVKSRSPTTSETVQVHAEVHSEKVKYPVIMDEREYENVTIGQEPTIAITSQSSPRAAILEKKGSGESSSSSLVFENVPDSIGMGKSKTSSAVTSASVASEKSQKQGRQQEQMSSVGAGVSLDEVDSEFNNLRLTIHADARAKRNSLPSNQRLQRDRESSSSPFNPFMVPLFRTDEFIAVENEALIAFNQALQDQIIEEEAEADDLVRELGGMIEDNHGLLLG